MADPSTYRPALGSIPTDPGVYQFRDAHGRVIYVGKAKSLRSRLSSYFQDPSALHPRTVTMVTTAASVEWTVVRTEVEALQLEYSWIKEFDPRFNVKYRDDKSYPFLAVTMDETYPRAQVMRGNKRKGVRYFGPYGHAWAIRETLDLLLRVFPLRTCSAGVFKRAAASGRPCLLGYIDKCSAPCVGRVTAEEHRQIAVDFCDFMAGATGTFVRRLQREMKQAAADLEFERAARLRDDLGAVTRALEKQAVVFADATDADVFAMAEDDLEAAAQVFHVRGGRIRGQRGWVVERAGEDTATSAGLVARLLEQVYGSGGAEAVPHEILVPALPDDLELITDWLTGLRGARVDIRVPRRGDKRTLQETAYRNATQALTRHKLARSGDLTKRSQALADLQRDLDLDEAPLRIECFDISHVQGTNMVASMVVFEDGLPTKSEYRHFAIREATDDAGAMAEVLTRRFTRLLEESSAAAQAAGMPGVGKTGVGLPDDAAEPPEPASAPAPAPAPARKARRFAYPPQLVVVDGGAPQVNAARQVLDGLGVQGVDVIGLAKRLEEVWLPGEEFPVVLQRTSEGLYLLQRARDEAHRFAISYHRQRRSTAMTTSVLDGIPGVGPARRKALLAAFGTVKALRTASADEVAAVPGIGPVLAETIVSELAKDTATRAPVVNVTTGEVE